MKSMLFKMIGLAVVAAALALFGGYGMVAQAAPGPNGHALRGVGPQGLMFGSVPRGFQFSGVRPPAGRRGEMFRFGMPRGSKWGGVQRPDPRYGGSSVVQPLRNGGAAHPRRPELSRVAGVRPQPGRSGSVVDPRRPQMLRFDGQPQMYRFGVRPPARFAFASRPGLSHHRGLQPRVAGRAW